MPAIATGGLARRYPPNWDQHRWPVARDAADGAIASLAELFGAMEETPKTLRLALKRFDAAMLR